MTDYVMTSTHVGGNVRSEVARDLARELERRANRASLDIINTVAIVVYEDNSVSIIGPNEPNGDIMRGLNLLVSTEY